MGFRDEVEIVERTVAMAKVERKPDGSPGKLIRIAPVSPREVRYQAKVSVLDDTTLLQLFQDDKHIRSIELAGREVRELDEQGRLLAGMKSLGNFDDPFGVPFFAPRKTLREWGSFPWPSTLSDRRMTFETEGDSTLSGDATVVTVRANYTPSPSDPTPPVGLICRISFDRIASLGWLPVRLERGGAADQEPTAVETISWSSIRLPSGEVAVPIRYEVQERALDPESGRYVATRERAYQIDRGSFVLRDARNSADPMWAQLGGTRQPSPAPVDDPHFAPSSSRFYLLLFSFCVALAVVLLYIRHRQTARARH
jgi:hypothetical protein